MSKILFISVNDVNAGGIRVLSACLRQHKHNPYIIFLKENVYRFGIKDIRPRKSFEEYDWLGVGMNGKLFRYAVGSEITSVEYGILHALIEEIGPGMIGFSVTTPLKQRIADITRYIKERFDIPVIWGGPHASVDSGDCLNYCEIACIGEGERTIVDIAMRLDEKTDIKGVNNLVYSKDSQIIKNSIYPLIQNLDEIPFKDILPDNKFLIENDSLVRDFNEASNSHNFEYHAISSRGCPYNCSYCCENLFKKIYYPHNFLRRRSPNNVVQELKEAKSVVDYKQVHFEDEVFSLDSGWLREFKGLYEREIDLPFICYIYPNSNIEEQLGILEEAGLVDTTLSVQSGSERINKIFNRHFSKELFLETADLLKLKGITFGTDIITYNPFEEEKDLESTLDILLDLPKPFDLAVNKLYPIKNTQIYDMIEDYRSKGGQTLVSEDTFNYYARLFWLASKCNKHVVRFIHRAHIFRYCKFLISWLTLFLDVIYKIKKAAQNPALVYKRLVKK